MGILGGLFGKSAKWFDCEKTLTLEGKISRLPAPQIHPDTGLFGAWFVPDDKSTLVNRNGQRNKNDMLELRLKLDPTRGADFLQTFKALVDKRVTVSGALVNDDALEGKAELHPFDLVHAPLEILPPWAEGMKASLKDPNTEIKAFRILAVSDASAAGPAPGQALRKGKLSFAYPSVPNIGNPELKYDLKPVVYHNTDFVLSDEKVHQKLELALDLRPAKDGGPTVFVADLVFFWN